ncbi:MAG: DUF2231 domain-containing protein [Nitrospinae bacterium]|nr:DUF2231 domain-containing protein [Nitrospinota bacterium]
MFFAKLHPLLVHFPVALLIAGTLFEFYGKLQKEEATLAAARFNLLLGFWTALAAAVAGILGALSLDVKPKFKTALVLHAEFASATLVLFAAALLVRRFWKGKTGTSLYVILLAAGLTCLLAAGYWGGEMVHRFGVATPRIN